jgi:hypothetical protein
MDWNQVNTNTKVAVPVAKIDQTSVMARIIAMLELSTETPASAFSVDNDNEDTTLRGLHLAVADQNTASMCISAVRMARRIPGWSQFFRKHFPGALSQFVHVDILPDAKGSLDLKDILPRAIKIQKKLTSAEKTAGKHPSTKNVEEEPVLAGEPAIQTESAEPSL